MVDLLTNSLTSDNLQEECRQLLELALNGKHLARCDVVNFNWEIEGKDCGTES